VLDPSKNFVTIQIMYIEEKNEKHGNTKYYFIHNRTEFEEWKEKGYLTQDEINNLNVPPLPENPPKPGMPVQPSTPPHDPTKIIQVLKTWWSRMNWKEQNQIYARCLRQIATDKESRTELDMIAFRDMKLKNCLKKWDLQDDNRQEIPVTPTIIDSLVPEVAQELLNNFELVTEATEEQLKN